MRYLKAFLYKQRWIQNVVCAEKNYGCIFLIIENYKNNSVIISDCCLVYTSTK